MLGHSLRFLEYKRWFLLTEMGQSDIVTRQINIWNKVCTMPKGLLLHFAIFQFINIFKEFTGWASGEVDFQICEEWFMECICTIFVWFLDLYLNGTVWFLNVFDYRGHHSKGITICNAAKVNLEQKLFWWTKMYFWTPKRG